MARSGRARVGVVSDSPGRHRLVVGNGEGASDGFLDVAVSLTWALAPLERLGHGLLFGWVEKETEQAEHG